MMQHYTEDDLRDIGKLCSNRLPPASAVQAMFLYEMQRETELEALFQGQMFRLANTENHSKSLESKVSEIKEQVKDLWSKVKAKDVNERLVASKVRTDVLHARLNQGTQRLDNQEARLVVLENEMVETNANKVSTAVKIASSEDPPLNVNHLQGFLTTLESLGANLASIDDDVQMLFEERDGLVALIEQANERIDKLEGCVRALTQQNSTNGSNPSSIRGSPPLLQHLPVQTNNGDLIDLSIPKGRALVPHRRDTIRTFTPGKPWMT